MVTSLFLYYVPARSSLLSQPFRMSGKGGGGGGETPFQLLFRTSDSALALSHLRN